jgi:acetoin utilization protein AcuB
MTMLIKNWMSYPVVSIEPDISMQGAKELMEHHGIHSLPVNRSGKLIGILTDGDLKKASASDATSLDVHELGYLLRKIKIATIMTRDPISIQPDRTLAEAAEIFLDRMVAVLPVMDGDNQLVGIISRSDLSRAFLSLTAYNRQGIQIGIKVVDRPGIAMDIAGCVRSAGGRIASLISTDSHSPHGYRQVYLRIYALDRRQLVKLSMKLGDMGVLMYVVDHKHKKRNVFAAA